MRVFVAGASGAIGRSLVPQLVAAGHEVTGMTRSRERAAMIEGAGATAVVCDALDAPGLRAAVRSRVPRTRARSVSSGGSRVGRRGARASAKRRADQ